MHKTIKNAYTRYSDQKYYISKILSNKFLEKNPNPTFTEEDANTKINIFDIPNTNTCFITGESVNGVGDHYYEINGYHKYTNRRGIDDPWNIIPVAGKINKSYKVFQFTMDGQKIKKNIGYQDLSDDELIYLLNSECDNDISLGNIYCKIYEWKKYVKQRGAVLSYEEPENFIKIRKLHNEKYNKYWDETIQEMDLILN